MSIHEEFVTKFEAEVFHGKRKMTEHERFMFRCGITVLHVFMSNHFPKYGLDWSLEFQNNLKDENHDFLNGPWQKQCDFYCTQTQEGIDDARNKQRDS